MPSTNALTNALPIILASSSTSREAILRRSRLPFSIIPSQLNEAVIKQQLKGQAPSHIASELAQQKAKRISAKHPHAIIIGADQLCELQGEIYDKPGNAKTAFQQLKRLSGHTHQLHTAVCLAQNNQIIWQYQDCAELTMRPLTDNEIQAYLDHDMPFFCCGSYQIESLGCHLFDQIIGSTDTIQGLPLIPLPTALRQHLAYQLG